MPEKTVYELAVLYHVDVEADSDKAAAKVKELIAGAGGKVIAEQSWGKRQLAYEIKKQTHAIYVFYDVEIAGAALVKLEAGLNIMEEVLRYLLYKPDLEARDAAAALRAAEEAEQAEAAGEEPALDAEKVTEEAK